MRIKSSMFSYVFDNTVYHLLHVVANNRKCIIIWGSTRIYWNDIRRLEGQTWQVPSQFWRAMQKITREGHNAVIILWWQSYIIHDSIILCYQVLRIQVLQDNIYLAKPNFHSGIKDEGVISPSVHTIGDEVLPSSKKVSKLIWQYN